MNTTLNRTIRVTLPTCVAFVRSNRGLGLLLLVYATVGLLLIFTTIVSTLGTNDLRIAGQHAQMTQQLWAAEAALDRAIVNSSKVLPPMLAAGTCAPWILTDGTTSLTHSAQYRLCSAMGSSPSSQGGPGTPEMPGSGLLPVPDMLPDNCDEFSDAPGGPCLEPPVSGSGGTVYDVVAQSLSGTSANTKVVATVDLNPAYVPTRAILTSGPIRLTATQVYGKIETLYVPPPTSGDPPIPLMLKTGGSNGGGLVGSGGGFGGGQLGPMATHGTTVHDDVYIAGGNPANVSIDVGSNYLGAIKSTESQFPGVTEDPPRNAIVISKLTTPVSETVVAGVEYVVDAEKVWMHPGDTITVDYGGTPGELANIHIICSGSPATPTARFEGGIVTQGSGFPPGDQPLAAFIVHRCSGSSSGPAIKIEGNVNLGRAYVFAPPSAVMFTGSAETGPIVAQTVTTLPTIQGSVRVTLPPNPPAITSVSDGPHSGGPLPRPVVKTWKEDVVPSNAAGSTNNL